MPKTRRKYKGNATATTISAGLSSGATSCVIGSATGWPTSGPFYVVVDPGLSSEEKILVGSISGTTISSLTRGVDDTTDQNHAAGCSIYPVFTAVDADEANELTSTYANQGGIVYQGASTFAQLAIGTAAHVLKVNSGATAPEWGQVATAGITDSAVTTAKIADTNVTLGKLSTAVQASLAPAGSLMPYAGSSAPTGWLLCYGQAVSRSTYADLYTVVGTTYGSGDGSSTLNVPDLRGRVIAGQDDMGGTSANRLTGLTAGVDGDTLGGTGGAESHTLTTAQLASHSHANTASASTTVSITDSGHTHTINGEGLVANVQDALNGDGQRVLESDLSTSASTEATASATTGITATGSTTVTMTNANTGGGEAHNNVQPTIILNYIIKT